MDSDIQTSQQKEKEVRCCENGILARGSCRGVLRYPWVLASIHAVVL